MLTRQSARKQQEPVKAAPPVLVAFGDQARWERKPELQKSHGSICHRGPGRDLRGPGLQKTLHLRRDRRRKAEWRTREGDALLFVYVCAMQGLGE